jgi:molybdopterin synthase catalytic subunit
MGGAVVRIQEEAIDQAALVASLAASGDGAVATFLGTVRDHNEGRRVVALEYHAYPAMAEAEMKRIADETRARFEISALVLVHRIGKLAIGDVSVLVAVAAPHRAAAFDACRHAMEEIKRRAPVWKREIFDEGSAWVGIPQT